MSDKRRIIKSMGSCIILFVLFMPNIVTEIEIPENQLTLLFTHDLHSYFLPVNAPAGDGNSVIQGGYARLSSLIQDQRTRFGKSALMVDAGDFSMGTLFHTIYPTDAAELRLMGAMGYEVVTPGNHEFDLRADNFARMLRAAKSSGEHLPALVTSNFEFIPGNPRSVDLQQAFLEFPVSEFIVLEKNGLRIGLFGLMGKTAGDYSAFPHDVIFTDIVQAAKRMVDELENKEKVDVIIALSHSGTAKDESESEDEILAREVPEIDVIISGHTHTILAQPIVIGKTFIVSSGSHGAYLGVLQLDFSGEGGGKLIGYELLEVTKDLPEDPAIAEQVLRYDDMVEEKFLAQYDLHTEQVLAKSDFNFDSTDSIFNQPRETGLGNLIADSFRYAVEQIEGDRYELVHLTIEPLGMICSTLASGDITVSDAFRVLSLGLGPDDEIGSPLVTFYLTGDEIRQTLELEATIAPIMLGDAHLQVSGITFTFNPYRVPFNRVTSVSLLEADGSEKPLDPQMQYRVATDYWALEALETVNESAYGMLKIIPKDRNGESITELEETILDSDIDKPGIQEVKEWVALTEYLKNLPDPDGDGVPNVPERYRQPEGRIVVDSSWNPLDLIRGGNYITFIVVCMLIFIIVIIGLLIWGISKLLHRVMKPRNI